MGDDVVLAVGDDMERLFKELSNRELLPVAARVRCFVPALGDVIRGAATVLGTGTGGATSESAPSSESYALDLSLFPFLPFCWKFKQM